MTALESFRLLATGFSAMSDEEVNSYLALTASFLDRRCLNDDQWAMTQALMAAHIIAMTERSASNATGGIVLSEREGDLSRSYGIKVNDPSWIRMTTYGEMLDDLLHVCGLNIMTRMG